MTIRQLRINPLTASMQVVALTALAMRGDRCLATGATDYLRKPMNLQQLLAKVTHLVKG